MQEYPRHAECIGHQARMLATRAAETAKRVFGDVVAALHRDVLDRVGHVLDGDLEKALGDFFRRAWAPRPQSDIERQRRELGAYDFGIERRIAIGTEHFREQFRIDLADHYIAVGDGERSAAPVRRRSRICPGRLRPDAEPRAIERADRPSSRGDRVDAHHRRAQSHSRHFGDE